MSGKITALFPDEESYKEEFDRLQNEHYEIIYKFIVRNIYDSFAAEDLTQNTFLALYMNLEEVLRKGNVRAWLFKTALNNIDHYRREWARKRAKEVDLTESAEVPAPPYETEEMFRLSLPNSLGERNKDILTLYFYHRYTLSEIAEMYGVVHGSMRVHMTRLVAKLRDAGTDWLS